MDVIKNIKILHIMIDDKFLDSAYVSFEKVAPGCNDFVCPNFSKKLKYIKKTPVKFISKFSCFKKSFLSSLKKYDFVILHSMTKFNKKLVMKSDNVLFVWIGWGYDYYELLGKNNNNLFGKETLALKNNLEKKSFLNTFVKKIFNIFVFGRISEREVLNKVKYFAPVLEDEFMEISQKNNVEISKYVDWNYYNSMFPNDFDIKCKGKNILVGNSASFENNHLEIFNILKNININDRKIICPLSYGDKKYGDYIEKIGYDFFGKNFFPLRNFMDVNEYLKTIFSCSHVLMNQMRQQAGSNIMTALFIGSKVFLNEKNDFYGFFKRRGADVFLIDSLSQSGIDTFLSEDNILKNKQIIKENENKNDEKTYNLIKLFLK